MRKVKRSIVLAVMVLMVATAFLGCTGTGGGGASVAKEAPNSAEITGKISWLMRSNPFENKWEQESVIPEMKKLYPKVNINMIIVPPDQVDPKLLSMASAGTPVDVFSMWGDSGFMDYYNKGLLLELTPYIQRDIKKEDFIDGVFDIYAVNGKYYSMPQVTNFSQMIVYNKDLFAAAGLPDLPTKWGDPSWTWDKMVEYAKKLTKNYGQGANAQYGIALSLTDTQQIAYLFGGDPFLPETYKTGVADKSNFDDPNVIEALQAISDLINVDKVHPTPAEAKTLSQMGPVFKTGKVGMATTLATQAYGNFKDVPFKWALAPLPTAKKSVGTLYNGAYFISGKSKAPEAAWALIKYMSTPGAAQKMRELTGFLVPLKSETDNWFKMIADKTGMTVDQVKEVTTGYPADSRENINHIFCGYREMSTVYNQGLDALWLGKVKAADAVAAFKPKLDETMKRIKASAASK